MYFNILQTLSEIHNRNTRSQSKNNLYIPKYSTSRCQKSIKFQEAIWISLPTEPRKQNMYQFKKDAAREVTPIDLRQVLRFIIGVFICFSSQGAVRHEDFNQSLRSLLR